MIHDYIHLKTYYGYWSICLCKWFFFVVGGGLPVVQKQQLVQKKLPWQQDKIAHNPLDSTSPLVKKGKQREVPKAKKPTPLKKVCPPTRSGTTTGTLHFWKKVFQLYRHVYYSQVILKEREERKQRRLLEERGLLPENELQPANEEEMGDTNATGQKKHGRQ